MPLQGHADSDRFLPLAQQIVDCDPDVRCGLRNPDYPADGYLVCDRHSLISDMFWKVHREAWDDGFSSRYTDAPR